MRRLLSLLLFLILVGNGFAADDRENFLSHGPSVAAYGRGEASVSVLDDVSSAYYNPALLSNLGGPAVSLADYILYEGSNYGYAGIGIPLRGFYLALSGINLKSGDVSIMQNINDVPTTINTNLWAYYLSVSRRISSIDTNVGINIKYVYEDLYSYKGGGVGADIGAWKSFEAPEALGNDAKINVGVNVQNAVQPQITLISSEEDYSTIYRAGVSYEVPVFTRSFSQDILLVSADAASEDNDVKPMAGVEYIFMNRYSLRAGYYTSNFTFGAGLLFNGFKIDYTFDVGDYTNFNMIGVSYMFGGGNQSSSSTVSPDKPAATQSSSEQLGGKGVSRSLSPVPFSMSLKAEAQAAYSKDRERLKKIAKEIEPLFKEAKRDYNDKRYLKAAEKFREMAMKYPEFQNAKRYLDRIESKMTRTSQDASGDMEDMLYALGYVGFENGNYSEAVLQWSKVLEIDPKRTELEEYLSKTKSYLADIERQKKDKETEEIVKKAFDTAVKDFELSAWVHCIKGMEQVQQMCRNDSFSKSFEYNNMAQDYIDRAVAELAKAMKKLEARPKKEVVKEEARAPVVEIDAEGAQKKYNDGLILYAQGKLVDAMRQWEIAARLDPNNEKAKKALEKAKEELDLSNKR
jgi:tetratricopeptide (TPR) repeat protein